MSSPTPNAHSPDLGVSIVVPIYNEVEDLPDLVARIGAAMVMQSLTGEPQRLIPSLARATLSRCWCAIACPSVE